MAIRSSLQGWSRCNWRSVTARTWGRKWARREVFLAAMDRVVPWPPQALIAAHPLTPGRPGRQPPHPRGTMLRIHCPGQNAGHAPAFCFSAPDIVLLPDAGARCDPSGGARDEIALCPFRSPVGERGCIRLQRSRCARVRRWDPLGASRQGEDSIDIK